MGGQRLGEHRARRKREVVRHRHDLELVLDVCPRTVLMDRGKIWADGETRAMLANAELMGAHGLEVPLSLRNAVVSS